MIDIAGGLGGLLLGAIFGSFFATMCLRWPKGRSVLRGRSQCDACGMPVPATRLIPLLSFFLSRGTARCCGTKIEPFHAQVEWCSALMGAVALGFAPSSQGLALAIFGWLLLPLFLLDLRHFWLPDTLTLFLGFTGLVLGPLLNDVSLTERLLTSLGAGISLAFVGWSYKQLRQKEGLGDGDPKLLASLALWLGLEGIIATLLGAALLGLAEALLRRRARDEALPLGSFLCVSALLIAAVQVASTH